MRATADLRRRILNRTARIAVIGQGYVGLSLACAVAEAGFRVTGVDVDARRVAALGEGRPAVAGVDEKTVRQAFTSGLLDFTTSIEVVGQSHLVFVCVPTPLHDGTPDLSYINARAPTSRRTCCRARSSRSSPRPTRGPRTRSCDRSWRHPGSPPDVTSCWRTRRSASIPGTPSSRSARSRAWSAG